MSEIKTAVPGEGTRYEQSQTDLENTSPVPHTESEDTVPEKPVRRSRKKAAEPVQAPEENAAGQLSETPQESKKPTETARADAVIHSVDGSRTARTVSESERQKLLELTESMRSGRYLTGTIQGVERLPTGEPCAVTYYGGYKVIIPASMAVEVPENQGEKTLEEAQLSMLNRRLGAEIDYVIRRIDEKSGRAVGNRLMAMNTRKKYFYFTPKPDGSYRVQEGTCCEARVLSVVKGGIFVDLYGIEVYIPLREISYRRIIDAFEYFAAGDRVVVLIYGINRTADQDVKVLASVKRTSENPIDKAFDQIQPGNSYTGSITMIDDYGVYVSLDVGAECRCRYPRRNRQAQGARVTVVIESKNDEKKYLWGFITHMTVPR